MRRQTTNTVTTAATVGALGTSAPQGPNHPPASARTKAARHLRKTFTILALVLGLLGTAFAVPAHAADDDGEQESTTTVELTKEQWDHVDGLREDLGRRSVYLAGFIALAATQPDGAVEAWALDQGFSPEAAHELELAMDFAEGWAAEELFGELMMGLGDLSELAPDSVFAQVPGLGDAFGVDGDPTLGDILGMSLPGESKGSESMFDRMKSAGEGQGVTLFEDAMNFDEGFSAADLSFEELGVQNPAYGSNGMTAAWEGFTTADGMSLGMDEGAVRSRLQAQEGQPDARAASGAADAYSQVKSRVVDAGTADASTGAKVAGQVAVTTGDVAIDVGLGSSPKASLAGGATAVVTTLAASQVDSDAGKALINAAGNAVGAAISAGSGDAIGAVAGAFDTGKALGDALVATYPSLGTAIGDKVYSWLNTPNPYEEERQEVDTSAIERSWRPDEKRQAQMERFRMELFRNVVLPADEVFARGTSVNLSPSCAVVVGGSGSATVGRPCIPKSNTRDAVAVGGDTTGGPTIDPTGGLVGPCGDVASCAADRLSQVALGAGIGSPGSGTEIDPTAGLVGPCEVSRTASCIDHGAARSTGFGGFGR